MKSIFESARFIRGSLLEVGSMVRARSPPPPHRSSSQIRVWVEIWDRKNVES
eukprot:COSAG01_NODE_7727_length_3082_cov_2.513577_4_plen_52_part_00